MKQYTISSKLLSISIMLFVVTVATLSITMWQALESNNQQITQQTHQALDNEIKQKLTATASQYSERVSAFINEAYRVPYSFSAIMNSVGTDEISRAQTQKMISKTLEKNSLLSSFYVQFEANGFDNHDQSFLTGTSHSVVGAGSFEVYYIRADNGDVTQSLVEDATQKYDETLNEFGIRAAEWFLCAKETLKPCLMEPYLFEVSSGQSELMTSLTVPIINQGKFVGLVGADINLPIFQSFIDELSQGLYQGRSKVTLLSERGFIVASSHYDNKGRPLSEAIDPDHASKLQALHSRDDGILETELSMTVAQTVNIDVANSTWSIVIEVDKKDALASALELAQNMKENANDMNGLQVTLGVVTTLIAVFFIWLMTKSIVAPINMLKQSMESLASEDGDLTKKIDVQSHAELIALGDGFNRFLAKLHSLISQLKQLTVQTQVESENTARISQSIRDNVKGQYQEIENVVTAVNQMSSTAQEVARASEQTANEADLMSNNVKTSQTSLLNAMEYVSTMSTESEQAKIAVTKVSQSSENISSIVDVIRSIADQTNLLALNAAIEAARAGDQGRGFAVVADEVRSLASKTQASTDSISELIASLHLEVTNASNVIEKGTVQAEMAVEKTNQALESITEMVAQIDEVSSQVTHIATAAEQQSAVTEEVNRNINIISSSACELSNFAEDAFGSSVNLAQLVKSQDKQLNKLKT